MLAHGFQTPKWVPHCGFGFKGCDSKGTLGFLFCASVWFFPLDVKWCFLIPIWYTGLLVFHFVWYAIDNTSIAGTCLLLASLDQRDPIVCLAWLWGPVVVLLAFFLCAAASVLFRTEMHDTFTLFCMAPCLVGLPSEFFYLSELLLIIKRNDINDLWL